jgi:hypothetical protein
MKRLQMLDRSVVQLLTLGLEQRVADVREWFPCEGAQMKLQTKSATCT